MTGGNIRKPTHKALPNTKTIRANGSVYLYFKTGKVNAKGKQILSRLPAITDPSFGAVYASHMGALSKTLASASVLTAPGLVRLYENSEHFKALAAGTQKIYGIYLRRFADNFQTAPAGEIARVDILTVADTLKPGAANAFVKTVNSLFAWGRKRGKIENDPCRDIDMNELGEHEPWPVELLEAGLACPDDDLRLAIHLLYFTAQRIGDVCAMRWGAIRNGEIHVIPQKTRRKRKELWIRLHRQLAAELDQRPRTLLTILQHNGKPISASTLRGRIQAFASELGYEIVPHGLRKNAVNALLEVGCSTAETAAISGQSLAIVEHYAKRRNQPVLGSSAILKWERGQNGN